MNRYIAELIGTFSLVFFGCGAVVVNDLFGQVIGHIGISVAFGFIVMILIYAIGNVSGAHMNPAVTIGFYAAGKFSSNTILPYIFSQCVGAILAATALWIVFPDHTTYGITLPAIAVWRAFLFEVFLSFFLMLVILNVSTGHKEKGMMAGVAVGGTVLIEALVGGPVTGASMNPARSLGPALVSGQLESLWLYLTAPILGAILATPLCRILQGDNCCIEEAEELVH